MRLYDLFVLRGSTLANLHRPRTHKGQYYVVVLMLWWTGQLLSTVSFFSFVLCVQYINPPAAASCSSSEECESLTKLFFLKPENDS